MREREKGEGKKEKYFIQVYLSYDTYDSQLATHARSECAQRFSQRKKKKKKEVVLSGCSNHATSNRTSLYIIWCNPLIP